MRVLLLNNIPAPYFDPLFERLADARDWELRVCYTSIWNSSAGWVSKPIEETSYRTIVLDRVHGGISRTLGSSISASLALFDEMMRERPDYAIIYGYTLLPQYVAILWSTLVGIPFAVIGDANVHADNARGLRRFVKRIWLKAVISQAAAVIYIGTANRMFWEGYGAPPGKLFEARYAVDNDHMARAIETARASVTQLRSDLRLTARVLFLFVGRLVKRKNVDLIVNALKRITPSDAGLLIVGDGPERASLESLAEGDPRVTFAGAVPQSELPRYYALADVLVLPASDEPWGLVINEAMAGGLAVIAHRECGAAVDLVGPENGVALKTLEVDELASAMDRIVRDDQVRKELQESSRQKIKGWSIESAARGIIAAVSQTAGGTLGDSRSVGEVE